jgi:transcriptional regulator with XRE-family HTH domain
MVSTMPKLLGKRIAEGRALRGFTVEELARRADLDPAQIAGYEAGEEPAYPAFRRVAAALKLPYEWFLPG